jgi:hypothetical protein
MILTQIYDEAKSKANIKILTMSSRYADVPPLVNQQEIREKEKKVEQEREQLRLQWQPFYEQLAGGHCMYCQCPDAFTKGHTCGDERLCDKCGDRVKSMTFQIPFPFPFHIISFPFFAHIFNTIRCKVVSIICKVGRINPEAL